MRVTVLDATAVATAPVAIVIPARNEAERIGACLSSLAAQNADPPPAVYMCVNDTTDHTAEMALDLARDARLAFVVGETGLSRGGVGRARAIGHALVARHGPATRAMLSTDADCIADPGWVRHMEEGLRRAPAVLGHIVPRADELAEFPESFHAQGRIESRYLELSMQFERLLDPDGAEGIGLNTAGGANLGFRTEVYRKLGGYASLPYREDRDLIDRAIRGGYAPRRVPDAIVHASMRVEGRACCGMSDAVAERLQSEDYALDTALAPFSAMLARHAGLPFAAGQIRRSEAERDIAALEDCVASLWTLERLDARRALTTLLYERYRLEEAMASSR